MLCHALTCSRNDLVVVVAAGIVAAAGIAVDMVVRNFIEMDPNIVPVQ